jgi:uncharacterized protein YpuA (DUF1002 family)
MSQTTTLILLPQTTWSPSVDSGNAYTVVGDEQPAASYVITPRALQTVNINLSDVNGNIIIQATLATSPLETDWFKVYELEANANAAANSAPQIASNASVYTNINGNFVYMRAKIVDFAGGVVNFVKLSY